MRIAIDMDDVIADALSALVRAYNTEYDETLSVRDFPGKEIRDAVRAERQPSLEAYLLAEDFFRHLDVKAGSQEVVARLHERYEVFITTAAMEFPSSFTPKYEWLREHFPFLPDSHFVFCGDKSIIHADYLIDDRPRHFERFIGQGIVFTAPHNLGETRYPRVENWQDVATMLLS